MSSSSLLSKAAVGAAFLLLPAGLSAQVWEVGNLFLEPGAGQADAHFGSALAVGDIEGDGWLDVAVGVPEWDLIDSDRGRVRIYSNPGGRGLYPWETLSGEAAGDRFATALAMGDFDGDGRAELAIGVPLRDLGSGQDAIVNAGQVRIAEQVVVFFFTQEIDQSWFAGATPERDDEFGSSLAVGDFDGDGYDDLAIGAPGETVGADVEAGAVNVVYGSADGLGSRTATFEAGVAGMLGDPSGGDHLGHSLAVADFDGDGYDDLAIGAPLRRLGGVYLAGQVHVLFGSGTGLVHTGQQLLDDADLAGEIAEGDLFGWALAAGRFDETVFSCLLGDCYADLAIGVPGEAVSTGGGTAAGAGKVVVVDGSATGLDVAATITLSQAMAAGEPEVGDHFGTALAAGHSDRTSHFGSVADLAVGVPGEDIQQTAEGMVHLFFGAPTGIATGNPAEQAFGQRAGFRSFPPGASDRMGSALLLRDLDGDGWGDLLVGIPGKAVAGVDETGAVQLLWGALFADGFDSGGRSFWSLTVP